MKNTIQEKLSLYGSYDKFTTLISKNSWFKEPNVFDVPAVSVELTAEISVAPKRRRLQGIGPEVTTWVILLQQLYLIFTPYKLFQCTHTCIQHYIHILCCIILLFKRKLYFYICIWFLYLKFASYKLLQCIHTCIQHCMHVHTHIVLYYLTLKENCTCTSVLLFIALEIWFLSHSQMTTTPIY